MDKSKSKSQVDSDDVITSIAPKKDNDTKEKNQMPDDLKENILKYVRFDDAMRERKEQIVELKKQMKVCEKNIIKLMEQIGEDVIELKKSGKIVKSQVEAKGALTPELIKTVLVTKMNDEKNIDDIIEAIDKARPVKISAKIKRSIPRRQKGNK